MVEKWIQYLYLLLVLLPLKAHCITADEAKTLVESLAESISEPKTFYRWQSENGTNRLIQSGAYGSSLHEFYSDFSSKNNSGVLIGGPGLYISDDPFDSKQFGTHIVEMEVPKGTPILNLRDPEVLKKLEDSGISKARAIALNPEVIVHYSKSKGWAVVKHPFEIQFRPLDLRNKSVEVIEKIASASLATGKPESLRVFLLESLFDRQQKSRGEDLRKVQAVTQNYLQEIEKKFPGLVANSLFQRLNSGSPNPKKSTVERPQSKSASCFIKNFEDQMGF